MDLDVRPDGLLQLELLAMACVSESYIACPELI